MPIGDPEASIWPAPVPVQTSDHDVQNISLPLSAHAAPPADEVHEPDDDDVIHVDPLPQHDGASLDPPPNTLSSSTSSVHVVEPLSVPSPAVMPKRKAADAVEEASGMLYDEFAELSDKARGKRCAVEDSPGSPMPVAVSCSVNGVWFEFETLSTGNRQWTSADPHVVVACCDIARLVTAFNHLSQVDLATLMVFPSFRGGAA
ncbi:hypothetical protein C8J57DRAFT_1516666 [Mycena rebaudengoi]|nr:hypothetical protein C8J57DRAFT_1516666 [Mycena rebaudengoi]